METDITKKAAEILIKCGYAMTSTYYDSCAEVQHHAKFEVDKHIDPFADTLEGRRQADALEDWLKDRSVYEDNHGGFQIWEKSKIELPRPAGKSQHQWRLDRIKWCLEQLCEDK